LKSRLHDVTISTVSMFAATICTSVERPAAAREKHDFRASTR